MRSHLYTFKNLQQQVQYQGTVTVDNPKTWQRWVIYQALYLQLTVILDCKRMQT